MRLIWATRGRSWGFRFLLDGGFVDPLGSYERAFAGAEGQPSACWQVGDWVALRFPDPLSRRDAAGRIIPHDFVVLDASAGGFASVDEGRLRVWPMVGDVYGQIWDSAPPSRAWIRSAVYNR